MIRKIKLKIASIGTSVYDWRKEKNSSDKDANDLIYVMFQAAGHNTCF